MKKTKFAKILSLVLSLMIILCAFPMTVFAEETVYPEIINYTGSVEGLDIDGDPIDYSETSTIEVKTPMYFDINFYCLNSEQTSGIFTKALDYEIRILPWTNYVNSNIPDSKTDDGEYERMLIYVPQELIDSNGGTYCLDMFIRAVKYPNVPLKQLGQTQHLSITGYKLNSSSEEDPAAALEEYKAEISEYYNTILDGDCSEVAKALAEEALDEIAAAADKDAVDAVNDEYYNKLDLQFDYEFALVDLLAALESDEYSEAVKAIIREDIAALGEAESTDELWEIYEEYDGKIGLQLMKEGVCAQLQEYIDAGASEAVKEIIADAVEDINACETMDEVGEVYGAAEDAIAEQLEKETNLEAVREAAINEILAAAEVYVTTFDKALVDEALNVINAAENVTIIENVKGQVLDRLAKNVLEVDYESAVGVNNTYRFWVKDRASMIQLMELGHGDGTSTRSFDRHHNNVEIVSFNINFEEVPSTSKDVAFEIWTITTNLADGDIGVRVKPAGSPAWEDASNVYVFENAYSSVDSGVISAALAKTEGSKGAVKATVVAGADTKIVQLKNKEGETFTFGLDKATENADGTLTFNCSVYFHGTAGTENIATVRYNDAYGWHDSDVTVEYTIK